MDDQIRIPCVMMRGGTSKGPFFLRSDLPSDPELRDALLIEIMGSAGALDGPVRLCTRARFEHQPVRT